MSEREQFKIHVGDCLEVMRGLPDSSVDAIVTDPPYGLNFMGKKWDYDVPSVEIWAECLRVLKPGGHLLAFAGTRTQHRMAVRIEDAGFEIRDMIAWVYGSGFPKSMDVTKAIDRRGGYAVAFEEFRDAVREAMKRKGVSRSDLQLALGNQMLSHYLTKGSQPAIPNIRDYRIIKETVGLGPRFDPVFHDEAEREVIDQKRGVDMSKCKIACSTSAQGFETSPHRVYNITAPATEAARTWSGWGTALKPALEPITVARKPLIGSVAENVLRHGTGALNVDGCRVPSGGDVCGTSKSHSTPQDGWDRPWRHDQAASQRTFQAKQEGNRKAVEMGRWPANLIHDGSEECVDLLKDASRFFYCAKASKADRGSGNNHPTVKPTDLMRYLCRLVTPPGGLVLDPFTGSGSTGRGAILEGFRFLGIERDPEYAKIAEERITASVTKREANKGLFD